jgi:hypothetical protein
VLARRHELVCNRPRRRASAGEFGRDACLLTLRQYPVTCKNLFCTAATVKPLFGGRWRLAVPMLKEIGQIKEEDDSLVTGDLWKGVDLD